MASSDMFGCLQGLGSGDQLTLTRTHPLLRVFRVQPSGYLHRPSSIQELLQKIPLCPLLRSRQYRNFR